MTTPTRHEPLAWICTREELQHDGDDSPYRAIIADSAYEATAGLIRMTRHARIDLKRMVAETPGLTWQEDPMGLAENLNVVFEGIYEFAARSCDMRHTDLRQMFAIQRAVHIWQHPEDLWTRPKST